MLDAFEVARRWKQIKDLTNRIKDPLLRESVLAEYQRRAIEQWGYCPDNNKYKPAKIELKPWQEEFLAKARDAVEYQVFECDEQVAKETKARMRMFIERGNKFSDLPEDLQNHHIAKLYVDTMLEEIKSLDGQLKEVL